MAQTGKKQRLPSGDTRPRNVPDFDCETQTSAMEELASAIQQLKEDDMVYVVRLIYHSGAEGIRLDIAGKIPLFQQLEVRRRIRLRFVQVG
jgi:hypothetical protein